VAAESQDGPHSGELYGIRQYWTSDITSNEPISKADAVIIDAHHVSLRAERLGGGTGRIYTITITATDSHGNTSRANVTVTVPHDQGK
jgi:hypothetical protein